MNLCQKILKSMLDGEKNIPQKDKNSMKQFYKVQNMQLKKKKTCEWRTPNSVWAGRRKEKGSGIREEYIVSFQLHL